MKKLILNEGYTNLNAYFEKGTGAKIKIKNKYYFDLSNCAGSIVLGHSNQVFKKLLRNIINKNISNFAYPNIYSAKLAALICKKIKNIKKIIFCNSGTEAVIKSLRISRAINTKKKVVSVSGSWHGSVDQLLYSPNEQLIPKQLSDGLVPNEKKNLIFIPYNEIDKSRKILDKNKKNINCIIIEPIQGALPLKDNKKYLKFLESYSKKNKIILIFDEIITAFRVNKFSVQNKYKINPDITTLGKICGGGLPIGIIGINKKIEKKLQKKKIFYGGTFSGNSINTYIGYETLQYILKNKKITQDIDKKSKYFEYELNNFFSKFKFNAKIYRHDSILRIVFSKKVLKNRSARDFVEKKYYKKINLLRKFLYKKQILYPTSGIIFLSYSLSLKDVDYIIMQIKNGFKSIFKI